jgi:Zn-dependent metalloprotease
VTVRLADQIQCVKRELRLRKRLYPQRVAEGRMNKDLADREIERMEAVLVSLEELAHGVTGSEARLVHIGQSGALNESVSDVFGSLIKQYTAKQTADKADWLIGYGLLVSGEAVRSMKEPGTAYSNELIGDDPQPGEMQNYMRTLQDNGGVHINSGIPNKAFYLAATAIGGYAWEKAGQVWYDTVRDPTLDTRADFAAFAGLTVTHASRRYVAVSTEADAIANAWLQVGVKPR